MKNIEVRKSIALWLVGLYGVFTGIAMLYHIDVPKEFVAAVSMILGFYFGKATALDVPGRLPGKDDSE